MTSLNIYVLIVLIIYLSAFFVQNLKTYFSVKQSIRGRSLKLTLSLVLSTAIYLLAFVQITISDFGQNLLYFDFMKVHWIQYLGAILITVALVIGLSALYAMKNSWRVGIKYDQKTDLVTRGIYALSRNPYFLSYDILFIGLFLIFPSAILIILVLMLMITFHFMILEEEAYLIRVQGEQYNDYKSRIRRYI